MLEDRGTVFLSRLRLTQGWICSSLPVFQAGGFALQISRTKRRRAYDAKTKEPSPCLRRLPAEGPEAERPAALRHRGRHPSPAHQRRRGPAGGQDRGQRDDGQRVQHPRPLRRRRGRHGHPHRGPVHRRVHGRGREVQHQARSDPALRQGHRQQPDLVRQGQRGEQRAGVQELLSGRAE